MNNSITYVTLPAYQVFDKKTGEYVAPTPKSIDNTQQPHESSWDHERIAVPIPQLGYEIHVHFSRGTKIIGRAVHDEILYFLDGKFAKNHASLTEEEMEKWWKNLCDILSYDRVSLASLRKAKSFYYEGLGRGDEIFTRPHQNLPKLILEFSDSNTCENYWGRREDIRPFLREEFRRIQDLPTWEAREKEWEAIKFVLLIAMVHDGLCLENLWEMEEFVEQHFPKLVRQIQGTHRRYNQF